MRVCVSECVACVCGVCGVRGAPDLLKAKAQLVPLRRLQRIADPKVNVVKAIVLANFRLGSLWGRCGRVRVASVAAQAK